MSIYLIQEPDKSINVKLLLMELSVLTNKFMILNFPMIFLSNILK